MQHSVSATFLLSSVIVLGFSLGRAHAQNDTVYTQKYLTRSTKFAWTTIGGDVLMLQGGTATALQNGQTRVSSFGNAFSPRVTIGGIHFWGHADFYVSIPVFTFQPGVSGFRDFLYQHGTETGLRVYPLRVAEGKVRPFVGISMRPIIYRHQSENIQYTNDAPRFEKIVVPFQAGVTYTTSQYLFSLSMYYTDFNSFDYHLTPGLTGVNEINPLSLNLSMLYHFDSDRKSRDPEGVRKINRQYELLRKEKKLSNWYWGVGLSSAFQMSKSEFIENNHAYLSNDLFGGLMPDITFGRFFNRPDMNVGVSYRSLRSTLKGFDTEINLQRRSYMIETYKNLFNWHGFLPFAGITASIEDLTANVNGMRHRDMRPSAGLIFGWDIRVTKTGSSTLRTNFRWNPNLHLKVDNERMMFDHLEFNFIQYVHYIGRNKLYKKHQLN